MIRSEWLGFCWFIKPFSSRRCFVVNSRAATGKKLNLQFSYYDQTLPNRLADDVRRSAFSTRPKYLNALLEKVLSLPMRTSTSSHIGEFFAWIELFESLPTERIWQLAPTQNRNFKQMMKHLLEIALSYYPENPQSLVTARDIRSPDVEIHQIGAAGYGRLPDMYYRPPAIKDFSS